MKIRLYQEKDSEEIEKLLTEFLKYTQKNYSKPNKEFKKRKKELEKNYVRDYRKKFSKMKNSRFLVAEDDNKIVAYILGSISINKFELYEKRGVLESIFVTKNYRSKNLGKTLYLKLITWFKKKGCQQLILEVAEGNPAMKIYEKWGFEKTMQEMRKKL